MSTVNIFGEIGVDFTAQDMAKFLDFANGPVITVNIASGGGSAFQGLMIYDLLIQSKKTIHTKVVGLAGSAASVIFMAGNTREMTVGGMVMVHNSWANFSGNAEEVKKKLGTLEAIDARMTAIFKSKTNLEDDKIKELLAAESFIGVDEAISLGFATGVADTETIAACIDLYNKTKKEPVKMATEEETKEAGLLAHIMAYFKKDEPRAMEEDESKEDEEKAMDDEEKEEEKAMEEEGEEKEPKSMEEDEEKEEAKAESDEEEKEEDLKARVVELEAKLAEAEAKAQSEEEVQAELGKSGIILDAMSDKKITMHEAKNLFAKSASDVSAALEGVSSNATGRGKTEEPKEDPNASVYETYQSLQGNAKTEFFSNNRDEIIKQMNTEK
jgi:ATP-dependent protease ClpP protease subunit